MTISFLFIVESNEFSSCFLQRLRCSKIPTMFCGATSSRAFDVDTFFWVTGPASIGTNYIRSLASQNRRNGKCRSSKVPQLTRPSKTNQRVFSQEFMLYHRIKDLTVKGKKNIAFPLPDSKKETKISSLPKKNIPKSNLSMVKPQKKKHGERPKDP